MTHIKAHLATTFFGILVSIVAVQSQLRSNYGESCSPGSIIGPRLCKLYGRTVSCTAELQGTCGCNLGDDAYFHEEHQLCVSKVDRLCLIGGTELGRKLCTDNADCLPEGEREDGHTIGTCKCLSGFEPNAEGLCIRNSEEVTGTPRTTSTKRPLFPGASESTTTTTETPGSTEGNPGGAGQVGMMTGLWAASILASMAFIHIRV